MAAAEYYNPGARPSPSMNQAQPPPPPPPQRLAVPPMHQHQQQQPPHLPYPVSDAPPPYTPYPDQARPHSQPPPQARVRFDDEVRPDLPGGKGSHDGAHPVRPPPPANYYGSSDKLRPPPTHGYPPTSQPSVGGSYPPPQNGYFPPQQSQAYADTHAYRQSPQPYYEDERSRSRSHDRRHRHHASHRYRDEPQQQPKKKSSGVNTFLGAGGGALIGDAIFPGLGTLGGAILGGLGGREYTKQRRSYGSSSRLDRRSYSHGESDYRTDDNGRGRRY